MKLRTLFTLSVGSLIATSVAFASPLAINAFSETHDAKVVLDLEENHFAVTGGCNTMMGKVTVTDRGAFRVKQGRNGAGLASTMMACPDALQALDDRLSQFILNTPKMVRKGESLYLVGTIEGETESVYLPVELDKGSYKDITAKPYEQVFYYVSEQQVPCAEGSEKQCLQVRQDKLAEWNVYPGTIEGFSPIEDYEYRLRLKEYKDDEGNISHVLDMVVEQGKVTP